MFWHLINTEANLKLGHKQTIKTENAAYKDQRSFNASFTCICNGLLCRRGGHNITESLEVKGGDIKLLPSDLACSTYNHSSPNEKANDITEVGGEAPLYNN